MGIKVNGIDSGEISELLEAQKTNSVRINNDASADKSEHIREEILNPPADEDPELVEDNPQNNKPAAPAKAQSGIYYVDGVLANGFVDGFYYISGRAANGVQYVNNEYMYFENGEPTARYNGSPAYGDDGRIFTGEYNNRMYVNGYVLTGVYEGEFYRNGVLDEVYTGNALDPIANRYVYCKDGEAFTGNLNGYNYFDGVVANGFIDDVYYINGITANGVYYIDGAYTYFENGEPAARYNGSPAYGDDGHVFTGEYNNRMYVNGYVLTGVYEGEFYRDGVLDETYTGYAYAIDAETRKSVYCKDGEPYTGTLENGTTWVDGVLANGDVDGLYYIGGRAANGLQYIDGEYMYFENGEPAARYNGSPAYGDDGRIFTGEYNNRMYVNGYVLTGVYEGEFYRNGILDETYTGNALDPIANKYVYCKEGVVLTGSL